MQVRRSGSQQVNVSVFDVVLLVGMEQDRHIVRNAIVRYLGLLLESYLSENSYVLGVGKSEHMGEGRPDARYVGLNFSEFQELQQKCAGKSLNSPKKLEDSNTGLDHILVSCVT